MKVYGVGGGWGRYGRETSRPTMNRPRPDQIDPMVPELPTAPYRADGGDLVQTASDGEKEIEAEAPLVPDLS